MERKGDEVHVNETEASGGSKEGVARWVLIIGLLLATGLLTIIWVTGAAFQGDVEEERTVEGRIEAVTEDEEETPIIQEDADVIEAAPELAEPESDSLDTIEN